MPKKNHRQELSDTERKVQQAVDLLSTFLRTECDRERIPKGVRDAWEKLEHRHSQCTDGCRVYSLGVLYPRAGAIKTMFHPSRGLNHSTI